jgi:hypothetical protein
MGTRCCRRRRLEPAQRRNGRGVSVSGRNDRASRSSASTSKVRSGRLGRRLMGPPEACRNQDDSRDTDRMLERSRHVSPGKGPRGIPCGLDGSCGGARNQPSPQCPWLIERSTDFVLEPLGLPSTAPASQPARGGMADPSTLGFAFAWAQQTRTALGPILVGRRHPETTGDNRATA